MLSTIYRPAYGAPLLEALLDTGYQPDAIAKAVLDAGVAVDRCIAACDLLPNTDVGAQVRRAFLVAEALRPRKILGVHRGRQGSHRCVLDVGEEIWRGGLQGLDRTRIHDLARAWEDLALPLGFLHQVLPEGAAEGDQWNMFLYQFLVAYEGDEHRNDLGAARRLVSRHGEVLRFSPGVGWLHWTRTRWQRDVEDEVLRYVKKTVCPSWYSDSDTLNFASTLAPTDDAKKAMRKRANKLRAFACASENLARMRSTLGAAETEPEVVVGAQQLDAQPMLLNVLNGTIDLRTGELRPHRREDYITRLAPVEYDPDAHLELWERFLDQATGGDDELKVFLQRIVGYTLTGDTGDELLFYVFGPGASGKSTFVEAVKKAVLGPDYSQTADFTTFLKKSSVSSGPSPEIASLAGARMVVSIEVDEGGQLAQGMVKSLTGGDTVSARHLYKDLFEFKPEFKLWLVANHLPRVDGTDDASFRRIRVVPFTYVVPEDDRDPQVKRDLCDPSIGGPAILAWAVQGCLMCQRDGLGQIPRAVREATEEYRRTNDPVGEFLEDCCLTGDQLEVTAAALYLAYQDWCELNGERAGSQKALALKLQKRGFKNGKHLGHRVWFGLTLAPPANLWEQPLVGSGRPALAAGPGT